ATQGQKQHEFCRRARSAETRPAQSPVDAKEKYRRGGTKNGSPRVGEETSNRGRHRTAQGVPPRGAGKSSLPDTKGEEPETGGRGKVRRRETEEGGRSGTKG
ncbi:unnamed protein product, partial [Ectocarpus sp. 13 AM-2016]